MNQTKERVALVTGASQGIGAACAAALSAGGYQVALVARSADSLEAVAASLPGESLVLPTDVLDPIALDAAFETVESTWGPVEVLVVNAGAAMSAPLVKTSDEDWQRMLDLNLTAPFRCLRRALPAMTAGRWGRVVVIASVAGKQGGARIAAYTASKHGVLGLVRTAAAEVARTGVTVNAVCPGYVDTPMTDATVAAIADRTGRSPEEARAGLARRQPIGRLIDPAEVAEAVRFCLVNAAVTGQGINVDGGAVQS
jgi:NAD(P)-dependent dehydrogenase (short-subunit alcohol dehydrogenase family)